MGDPVQSGQVIFSGCNPVLNAKTVAGVTSARLVRNYILY